MGGGKKRLKAGDAAPEVTFRDLRGGEIKLADLRGAKGGRIVVIVFWSPASRWGRAWAEEISNIAVEYKKKNVIIAAVDPNSPSNTDADGHSDARQAIAKYKQQKKLEFEIYVDAAQAAADKFGAENSSDVFVVGMDNKIKYTGPVNDMESFAKPKEFKKNFLRDALDALLSRRDVSVASVAPRGLAIVRTDGK